MIIDELEEVDTNEEDEGETGEEEQGDDTEDEEDEEEGDKHQTGVNVVPRDNEGPMRKNSVRQTRRWKKKTSRLTRLIYQHPSLTQAFRPKPRACPYKETLKKPTTCFLKDP